MSVLLFSLLAVNGVVADQSYSIPLTHDNADWRGIAPIPVTIPASPSWAHDQVAKALPIWSSAQQWFAATYFPGNAVFTFAEVPEQNATDLVHVSVSFVPSHSLYNIHCPAESVGCAHNDKVYFDMASMPQQWMLHSAVHEFGHILGLGHTSTLNDLMCGDPYKCTYPDNVVVPSTLDLYAVHLIAVEPVLDHVYGSVTLLSSIPYLVNPPITVPEFSLSIGVTILSLLSCLVIVHFKRRI